MFLEYLVMNSLIVIMRHQIEVTIDEEIEDCVGEEPCGFVFPVEFGLCDDEVL